MQKLTKVQKIVQKTTTILKLWEKNNKLAQLWKTSTGRNTAATTFFHIFFCGGGPCRQLLLRLFLQFAKFLEFLGFLPLHLILAWCYLNILWALVVSRVQNVWQKWIKLLSVKIIMCAMMEPRWLTKVLRCFHCFLVLFLFWMLIFKTLPNYYTFQILFANTKKVTYVDHVEISGYPSLHE